MEICIISAEAEEVVMEYKVSVIIPVYNAEKYLRKAIDSVIQQSIGFANIQLLLCDDHSTDRSLEICNSYKNKFHNVEVYQTESNTGSASGPRNVCLSHVCAPYIMFLDNDDLLKRNACEFLLSKIDNSEYDFVKGCYDELHYGRKLRHCSRYDNTPEREFIFPADALDFRSIADPFWTAIFRSEIIKNNNLLFDLNLYGEDTIFMLKYLVHSRKALHIKNVVYNYRIRDNSLFHVMDMNHFKGVIKGDSVIKETLLSHGYDDYWKSFISDHVSDFLDVIANSDITDSEIEEIIAAWFPEIKEAASYEFPSKTPYGNIIFSDAFRNDLLSSICHMKSLHTICQNKNASLKDVINSKTWRLISKANQLIGR